MLCDELKAKMIVVHFVYHLHKFCEVQRIKTTSSEVLRVFKKP